MTFRSLDYELTNRPVDGITRVYFHPNNPSLLLVSSWDRTVSLHDVKQRSKIGQYVHRGAVLDCCVSESNICYSGGLGCDLISFDLTTQNQSVLHSHDAPIRCVSWTPRQHVIATGSWDSTVKFRDPRIAPDASSLSLQADGKVYTMDFTHDGLRLVVGVSGRQIDVYDLRRSGLPPDVGSLPVVGGQQYFLSQRRSSPFKFQTRCLRTFLDDTGFVLSTVEGRVGVEFFDPTPHADRGRFAFRCHRVQSSTRGTGGAAGVETLFPVNTISFHPTAGSFVTGGCDGKVVSWDARLRKRVRTFPETYPESIASLSYNCNGDLLAIASSYTFEYGLREDSGPDRIFIKPVTREDFVYAKKPSVADV